MSDSLRYDFCAPSRIVFGWGRREEIGACARELGRRAFLLHGSRTLQRSGEIDRLIQTVVNADVECIPLGEIHREPLVEDVDQTVQKLLQHGVDPHGDLIIAVGGGSAIDLGKAVAALATNRGGDSVRDFLEGVGKGLMIETQPLPLLAVPTTAGTGSEATKNAVISSIDPVFKKSLRSNRMVPPLALVDPELTIGLSPKTTAFTGMDAVTQLIESYLSRRSAPLPMALAWEGLDGVLDALIEAVENGASKPAREKLAQAALWSGMALANSGLGMAHGVAAALGVACNVPHGLACAVMLPIALRANRQVSEHRLAELALPLTGKLHPSPDIAADAVVDRVTHVCRRIGVPARLGQVGASSDIIDDLVRLSKGNSMSGNPRDIGDDELKRILEENL